MSLLLYFKLWIFPWFKWLHVVESSRVEIFESFYFSRSTFWSSNNLVGKMKASVHKFPWDRNRSKVHCIYKPILIMRLSLQWKKFEISKLLKLQPPKTIFKTPRLILTLKNGFVNITKSVSYFCQTEWNLKSNFLNQN